MRSIATRLLLSTAAQAAAGVLCLGALYAASGRDVAPGVRDGALLLGGAVLVLSGLAAAGMLRRWVGQPVARLATTARRIEAGEDVEVQVAGAAELAELAATLESMRVRLLETRAAAEQLHRAEAVIAREQATLNDFTELLSYLSDERVVIEATVTALADALGPDGVIVHLTSTSTDRATVVLTRGEVAAVDLTRQELEDCPGVRRGEPYLLADVSRPLAVPCPAHGATAGTVACLPLVSDNERIGAVHLVWTTPTRPAESTWSMVDRVCEASALTIANRRLVSSLEASANTDPRTRLANSRSFDVQAERILAMRAAEPVGVLMLDLDHFKALNDRYGHPAGDEALKIFADLLRKSLRGGDLAARYGGEEFAVLLPGANLAVARRVGERIRSTLEGTPIVLGPGVAARVTVSVGVACAPADGTDRVTLLAAADRALYAAKHGGRNRVMTSLGEAA